MICFWNQVDIVAGGGWEGQLMGGQQAQVGRSGSLGAAKSAPR